MANLPIKPQKTMPNLVHIVDPYADVEAKVLNVIVEINSHTLNKYELITETGHLKLDRVGYAPLVYPFAYGAIPQTWDQDNDPLDVEIVNVMEPIAAGALVEARIIGIMKFEDGGEIDDKVIAVLAADKRQDHIQSFTDLGEHFQKETTYYWEHYKDLKKPGTCKTLGFFDANEAVKIIAECVERYKIDYLPKFE
ncbi:MAG: inorganic diphosphatase [bacterium]